jgi:hypothetical protein
MADALAIPPPPKRRLRKRTYTIDKDALVETVLDQVQTAERERSEWMDERVLRYAKLRGWTERDNPPWDDCSNTHVPVMMANSLRVKAGLFNAVLGMRPVMTPRTTNKTQRQQAEQANQLIDYQVFVEGQGEKWIDAYVDQFIDESCVFSHQRWSKEQRIIHDVRVFPTPDIPVREWMASTLGTETLLPDARNVVMTDEDGYEWTAETTNADQEVTEYTLSVYDRDDRKVEVLLEWEATVFDGPAVQVENLEDVVVPIRCENPQPVTPSNPFGAPWVARLTRVNCDHVRRMQKNGTYDQLTADDLEEALSHSEGRDQGATQETNSGALKDLKDAKAGLAPQPTDESRDWITVVEWYGAYDLNGDGLEEEVIFTVLREPEKLARVRYLSEMYPGLPPTRPISYACVIPVKGEIYGISYPELMEGLHDFIHIMFNQVVDRGDLANQPFGFYRASSGLKPEVIRLWPGDLYPVDNPQQDVAFPQMPHADQSFGLNMIALGMQFLERLTQIGPLQQGQVPTGKASALRTLGTTMAILQQGAALPEQILRRLFIGLSQVWQQIHRLNGRFLPKKKQYLIVGKSADQDDAYAEITDPRDLAVSITFDFQATLLNTNKGLVSSALVGLGQALINPLTMQFGIVNPETVYNWAKDLIQANQLDPSRYIVKPKGAPEGGERWTWEEALLLILENRMPDVAPLEGDPAIWQQKALEFMQSDEFGHLSPAQVILFKELMVKIVAAVRQQVQRQQMMQAASQFSSNLGQQGQGQHAPMGEVPGMQAEQGTQTELMGAMNGGGPGAGA